MSNNMEDTSMTPKAQCALVPKLRFPEFRDAGAWEEVFGDNLFEQVNDRNHEQNLPVLAITQENGAIPRDLINYHVVVTEKSIESYKVVQVSDFIISLRSFQGGIEYSQHHGICSPAYVILRRLIDGSDIYFKHYFKTERFIQLLTRNLEGLRDGKMISYRQFSELLLPVPKPSEQQKIADCLSSIDELISLEAQKLDALKAHKKGLMQQLFPTEGETLPKLRFPEFRDAGEWFNEPMEELYTFKGTNSLSREKLNYEIGSVKNIHYGDIHTKFSTHFEIQNEVVPYINPSEPLYNVKPESYCVEGDMIFADASEDTKDIGKCIEVIMLNNERLLSGLHTILARPKGKRLIIGFGGHLFRSDSIRKQIQNESQGTKVLGLSTVRLSKIKICYPKNKAEQQKIADCLSSIDDLIALQIKKLDSLKVHKKGLMQQLFPSPGEVRE